MIRSFTLVFLFGASITYAQLPLPMHEAGPGGTLLLADNIESIAGIEASLRSVTVISPGLVEVQRIHRFLRFNPPGDSAMWPTRLAARLDGPVRQGMLYLEGEVSDIDLFEPEDRSVYFWSGDTLDPLILSGGRDLRYIWKSESDGDRWLVAQELNDANVPRDVTTYHIARSGCRTEQRDSVAVVYCGPDDIHAVEPAFVFVLVNGEAVHAWREPSDAQRYPERNHRLLAAISRGSESALYFTTGEVLSYKRHRWVLKARRSVEFGQAEVAHTR
ncbi:MAG TPA: hypothetical protein PK760_00570 [Flavobacteriales bacterium]|nr:hypothetical protein [Flavobacteriales bacterium]